MPVPSTATADGTSLAALSPAAVPPEVADAVPRAAVPPQVADAVPPRAASPDALPPEAADSLPPAAVPPALYTARLVLRRWTDADRSPFAQLNADPEVMRYFRAPLNRAASDALIDRIEQGFDELGYGLWAVELRADGQFIGFTGLARQTFDASFTPAVEVGWRLARSAWGHGYATEAARAALDFGFGAAGLDEIVSLTTRSNVRSQAVMRRLGMTTHAGDDFEYPLLPSGHLWRPHVLYRLTQDEWAQ